MERKTVKMSTMNDVARRTKNEGGRKRKEDDEEEEEDESEEEDFETLKAENQRMKEELEASKDKAKEIVETILGQFDTGQFDTADNLTPRTI